jgi:hypothetical protein
MAGREAPPKYAPLAMLLEERAPATTPSVTLQLAEIECRIGRPLPAGAWARGWWQSTHGSGRPRPWVAAGWRVVGVAMRTVPPSVTFARQETVA